jgi:hypothetical protein
MSGYRVPGLGLGPKMSSIQSCIVILMSTIFSNVNKAQRCVLSFADPNNGLRHDSLNFILIKIRFSLNHVIKAEKSNFSHPFLCTQKCNYKL